MLKKLAFQNPKIRWVVVGSFDKGFRKGFSAENPANFRILKRYFFQHFQKTLLLPREFLGKPVFIIGGPGPPSDILLM